MQSLFPLYDLMYVSTTVCRSLPGVGGLGPALGRGGGPAAEAGHPEAEEAGGQEQDKGTGKIPRSTAAGAYARTYISLVTRPRLLQDGFQCESALRPKLQLKFRPGDEAICP